MTHFKAIHPVKIRDFIYSLVGLVKGLHSLGKAVSSLLKWVREIDTSPFNF